MIKIAKDWQKASRGDTPKGGYISNGLTKYVFEVFRACFNGTQLHLNVPLVRVFLMANAMPFFNARRSE